MNLRTIQKWEFAAFFYLVGWNILRENILVNILFIHVWETVSTSMLPAQDAARLIISK